MMAGRIRRGARGRAGHLLLDEVLAVRRLRLLSEESRRAGAARGEVHGDPRSHNLEPLPDLPARDLARSRHPAEDGRAGEVSRVLSEAQTLFLPLSRT